VLNAADSCALARGCSSDGTIVPSTASLDGSKNSAKQLQIARMPYRMPAVRSTWVIRSAVASR
jgi:hypothetical protein